MAVPATFGLAQLHVERGLAADEQGEVPRARAGWDQEAAPPVHEEREEKERWDARELEEGGKKFEAVLVQPCFL